MRDKTKIWTKPRFVETVAEIVDFFVNNHCIDVEYGKKKLWRPYWYTYVDKPKIKNREPWTPRRDACWKSAQEVSFVLSCITAQHTAWGDEGVPTETPFFEMQMWKVMSLEKRQQLAAVLYEPHP